MTDWVRLWHDMPTDPKWRVIARKSGQPLPCVLAIFTMLMVEASRGADRGSVAGWRHEDAAAALDMEEVDVAAIVDAMQGRVIIGARLSGWERRQPKRDDDSTARVREHRKRKSEARERDVTQRNAPDRDTDTEDSDADASAAAAPAAPPAPPSAADMRAAIYASAVPMLIASGRTDRDARSLIGRWRKDHTDGAVLDAISAAEAERPSEPVAWIIRTLETRNGNRTRRTLDEQPDLRGRRPDPALDLLNASRRAIAAAGSEDWRDRGQSRLALPAQ